MTREHLGVAAQSLERTKSTLGAYYRRMKARLGAPEAITAAATRSPRLLKHGTEYVDVGEAHYRPATEPESSKGSSAEPANSATTSPRTTRTGHRLTSSFGEAGLLDSLTSSEVS